MESMSIQTIERFGILEMEGSIAGGFRASCVHLAQYISYAHAGGLGDELVMRRLHLQ